MKRKIFNVLLISIILIFNCLSANSEEKRYKFVPIEDKKTNIEFARTIIPTDFEVKSDIIWARDLEEPVMMIVSAKSTEKDVLFFYSTKKTYADINNTKLIQNQQKDTFLKVLSKKFLSPEEYIRETIYATNPNATDIELLSTVNFPQELNEYLIGEMYKKIDKLTTESKRDRLSSKIKINNPYAKPYIVTYKFKENNKTYKQTFITMFTSVDFNITQKTNYNDFETEVKKLWTLTGLYSYRAEESQYENHFDDFIVFVSNTMQNQKAKDAVQRVKIQMLIELNPSFRDYHTGSPLKNLPSDLFRRYYSGGTADYGEDEEMIIPNLNEIRWLTTYLNNQSCFDYKKISSLWKQKLYVPQKYKYVYYNTVKQELIISETKQNLKGLWIKLKVSQKTK